MLSESDASFTADLSPKVPHYHLKFNSKLHSLIAIGSKDGLDLQTQVLLHQLAITSRMTCDRIVELATKLGIFEHSKTQEFKESIIAQLIQGLQQDYANDPKTIRGRPSMSFKRNQLVAKQIEHEMKTVFGLSYSDILLHQEQGVGSSTSSESNISFHQPRWHWLLSITGGVLIGILLSFIASACLSHHSDPRIANFNGLQNFLYTKASSGLVKQK